MPDIDKVLKGLECCKDCTNEEPFAKCKECPYNEISVSVQDCRAVLSADALELMKRLRPVETEIEGGGSAWYLVCPECHAAIGAKDRYCRYCGQAIKQEQ